MKIPFLAPRSLLPSLTLLLLAGVLTAQGTGPDVIVGDVSDASSYGSSGGISAFALGTTSCNIGTQPLQWQSGTNQHPVIAQNLYRVRNGRFEQVGMSWLKHGFAALAMSLCGTCQNPGTSALLGVGCSDPYGSGLNGSQSGLGPRFEVNASTGYFPYPYSSPAYSGNIARRLQVANSDLDPALNAGATYLAEGHYVTPDDAAAGNKNNNASYRRAYIAGSGANYTMSFLTGAGNDTVRQKPAIEGWRDLDATVTITYYDVPNDGRFIIAHKAIALAGGFTRHEYAVHNLSSDRSGASFTVNFPAGTTIQNPGFHDVPYHSGEPFNSIDWTPVIASGGIAWSCTETFNQNLNANALRFSTTYSFWVEANQAPTGTSIGLFKPPACPPQPTWPSSGGFSLAQNQAYDFVSLVGGTPGPAGDDTEVTALLPFTFPFYGQSLTQIKISSNGYLCLPTEPGTVFTNTNIPNATQPNGLIAGLWTDLNPGSGGSVTYGTVGVAPSRRFVVNYANVPHYPATGAYSFQIILNEAGHTITSTIVSVTNNGSDATRGVEDPTGGSGTQGSFNTANSAPPNSTWVYTPQLGVIPYSAVLTAVGNGAPSTVFGASLLGRPNRPYLLAVDTSAGPTSLGSYGILNLGLSPGFAVIRDGIGIYFLNPADMTDGCGVSDTTFTVPPSGISGFNYYVQCIVWDPGVAPNTLFHISNPIHLVVP